MFHAVREWWAGGRGKATAGLFVFEFVVVLAGVFAAQALADWNAHRNALSAIEDTREKADRDVAFHYAVAVGWKRAVPCLNQRMSDLMRQLGSSRPIDAALLRRPAMEGGNLQLPSETERHLLAERYGLDRSQDYWAASQNVTKLSNNVTDIIRAWSGFAMVDSANGPISASDRHDARLAASAVKAALRGLDISADNIIGRARAIGVQPDTLGEFRPIENCDDLWRNNMTHPNVDTR
jgi:hypothetical protein